MFSGKRYFLVTLGCHRNEVESDLIRSFLSKRGLIESRKIEDSDIVIVNTCGFIKEACDEAIDTILEIDEIRSSSSKKFPILVLGCMGERYRGGLLQAMPEISCVLGVDWPNELEPALSNLLTKKSYEQKKHSKGIKKLRREIDSSENATLFVRISDGCSNSCTFCTIPRIRGPYRSRNPRDICEEIERLAGGRKREVVLLAQDSTRYGSDLPGGWNLAKLTRRISQIENVHWLRLLYLQPDGVNEDLIDEIANNPKVCKYLDIPFQHASEKVLKRMGRRGCGKEYLELISLIRKKSPEVAIRTTIMVGFPGEQDEDFDSLLNFVKEARFDWLGLFIFSPEEGTPASKFKHKVTKEIAQMRYDKIAYVQEEISQEHAQDMMGRKLEITIDGGADIDYYDFVGRSYREAPEVDGLIYIERTKKGKGLMTGDFLMVEITGQEGLDLVGKIQ